MLNFIQLYIAFVFVIKLVGTQQSSCSKSISIKHGKAVSCSYAFNIEFVKVECNLGYEFQKGITTKTFILNYHHINKLECDAIGCRAKNIPKNEDTKKKHLIVKYSHCEPSTLKGHCLPEESYIDFECAPGYLRDENYGFMRVKCLNSYMWDNNPRCHVDLDYSDLTTMKPISNTSIANRTTTSLSTSVKPTTEEASSMLPLAPQPLTKTNKTEISRTTRYKGPFQEYLKNHEKKQVEFVKLNGPRETLNLVQHPRKHECLLKTPARPLNGRRETLLLINKNGSADGSVVKFICNPFYKRVGQQRLYCIDGKWEEEIPNCLMSDLVCRKKPSMKMGNAQIIQLNSKIIKNELTHSNYEKVILYQLASYTCPGNRFLVTDMKLIKFKTIKEHRVGYIDISCIGKEKWEPIKCG